MSDTQPTLERLQSDIKSARESVRYNGAFSDKNLVKSELDAENYAQAQKEPNVKRSAQVRANEATARLENLERQLNQFYPNGGTVEPAAEKREAHVSLSSEPVAPKAEAQPAAAPEAKQDSKKSQQELLDNYIAAEEKAAVLKNGFVDNDSKVAAVRAKAEYKKSFGAEHEAEFNNIAANTELKDFRSKFEDFQKRTAPEKQPEGPVLAAAKSAEVSEETKPMAPAPAAPVPTAPVQGDTLAQNQQPQTSAPVKPPQNNPVIEQPQNSVTTPLAPSAKEESVVTKNATDPEASKFTAVSQKQSSQQQANVTDTGARGFEPVEQKGTGQKQNSQQNTKGTIPVNATSESKEKEAVEKQKTPRSLSQEARSKLANDLHAFDDKNATNDLTKAKEMYGDIKLNEEQSKNQDKLFLTGKGKEELFRMYAEQMKTKGDKLSEQDLAEMKPKAAEIISRNMVVDHKDKFDDIAAVNPQQLNKDRDLIAKQQAAEQDKLANR